MKDTERTFETGEPRSGPEIVAALERLHDDSQRYMSALSPSIFSHPQGPKWAPADHVRHLSKSSRALISGLSLPNLALGFMFGRSPDPSRSFPVVREVYRARLQIGGSAGRFAPSARPLPADPGAWQSEVLSSWSKTASALRGAATGWAEPALDRYRLPHPLLGRLTVREMLFFTLYHDAHHLNLVASRVEAA